MLSLGALAYFAGALVWLSGDRAELAPRVFPAGSAHNTGPQGATLAFKYLKERGRAKTATLALALEPTAVEPDAVVFRLRPGRRLAGDRSTEGPGESRPQPALELLGSGEEAFVRAGGRLVLALDASHGPLQAQPARRGDVRKVFPLLPGVRALQPDPPRVLAGRALADAHGLFTLGADALLARIPLGAGDVILMAAPELLENLLLGRADHLALLLGLAGDGRPVYFDERAHGAVDDPGLFSLLASWGFGPTLALSALAGALAFWRARSRLGPPEDDHRETRSEAVDLVDSLGRLYDRTLTRDEALLLHAQGFERLVSARTGLKGAELRARTQQLLGAPPKPVRKGQRELPPHEFSRRLKTINDAYRRLLHARTR
jgi:hypothetical protein